MSNPRLLYRFYLIVVALTASVVLTACTAATLAPTPTAAVEPTTSLAATAVPATATAEPTVQPPQVLGIGLGADSELGVALQALAGEAGLTAAFRDELSTADLTADTRVVIVSGNQANLTDLAAAQPQTQFVWLGEGGPVAGANLTVITGSTQAEAFAAGYVAALVTEDWRVAALTRSDTPLGPVRRDAFQIGAIYHCGLCNPKYDIPPAGFPTYAEAAGPADWTAALDSLQQIRVKTVYLDPDLASPELLAALTERNFQVIVQAAADAPAANQIALVQSSQVAALQQVWPGLLAGESGGEISASVAVTALNSAILTPARMRLVENMLDLLNSGAIYPGGMSAE